MGKRRAARERALRALFELEFNDASPEEILARPAEGRRPQAIDEAYALRLVRGILARREEIDGLIRTASKNWRVSRMGVVDRNVLRLAIFEMLEDALIAPAIIMNEALEIAKRYSGEEAAVFINGVLDAVGRKIRPDETWKKSRTNHERTEEPSVPRAALRSRPARRTVPQ
jgi:N utilization substance protein B